MAFGRFFAALYLLTFNLAMADVVQQWYQNPQVVWSPVSNEFRTCMTNQIILQKKYGPESKVVWAYFGVVQTNMASTLSTIYCLVDDKKNCKQGFVANVVTGDASGWKDEVANSMGQVISASQMSRYLEFKDSNTGAPDFTMDLEPCKSFFGIK